MKPSVGRWVHWTTQDGVVQAALIVECTPRAKPPVIEASYVEQTYDVTPEVHYVRRVQLNEWDVWRISAETLLVLHAEFTPAHSDNQLARNHWSWPPRE